MPRPVWVVDSGSWNVQLATRFGILVDWRRHPLREGWQGLVVTASGGGEHPWSLSMEWRDAERLRPILEIPPEPGRAS